VHFCLVLDIVVEETSPVLELLASVDQSLLFGRVVLLDLDQELDILDGVIRVDMKGDRPFTSQRLDEDFHVSSQEFQLGALRDVVTVQRAVL